jgi:hypothetical protein
MPGGRWAAGDVEGQRQLVGRPNLFDQQFKPLAQISDSRFLRRPVAKRGNTRAELGRGAPDAVLVLLYDVGHVDNAGHDSDYRTRLRLPMERASAALPAALGWVLITRTTF